MKKAADADIDLLAVGRVGVDLYPEQQGAFSSVKTFSKSLGGSAANVAVATARYGHRAALLSKVGDDMPAPYVFEALKGFGVDTSMVGTSTSAQTPIVIAELNPADEPNIAFYRRPMAPDLEIRPGEVADELLARVRILWVTGTGLSVEPSLSAHFDLLRRHAEHASPDGVRVLDLDWRPVLWESAEVAGNRLRSALPYVTHAIGNIVECAVAASALPQLEQGRFTKDDAADLLLGGGVRCAIVKMGSDGVYVATPDGRHMVDPCRVEVVCGLGAGDAFGGATCHGILEGWPIEKTVRFANAAGAIVASRLACADAMPTEDEVDDFLNQMKDEIHA